MRERTRRQLCQLLFVAGCVVPTLGMSGWAAYRISPVYAAAERKEWEQRLFDSLGLLVRIGRVEHPLGGSTLLSEIQLIDPDGLEPIGRLRQAEFKRLAAGTVIVLSQPEVSQGKLLRLWDVLHYRVLRGLPPSLPVQVAAAEMTLEVGGRAQSFAELSCSVEPREFGVVAVLEFRLVGMEKFAALQIVRNRQVAPPSTRWQLDTPMPIPCTLFEDYLPGLVRLGRDCAFQGTVTAAEMSGEWSAELRNSRFLQVDLESLTESYPQRIGGLATVRVDRAVFTRGVLAEASGETVAHGGTISNQLLVSLADQLGGIAARSSAPYTPYSELACEFAIGPEGLKLTGRCMPGRPGTVVNSPSGELLVIDGSRSQPLVGLVRALSPASQWLVPATSESQRLLAALPLPAGAAPHPSLAQHPRVRFLARPSRSTEPRTMDQSEVSSTVPFDPPVRNSDGSVLPARHLQRN